MAYFIQSFRIELLRRLRSRGMPVLLVLAVLLTVWAAAAPGSRDAVVRVGLVLPPSGQRLETLLLERSSELVRFIPTDEATADRKVLSGQWDCALVAHEDFEEKLERLDTRNLFTLKTGPGSTVYPLVQETVAACVTGLLSPEMARDYLLEQGIDASALEQRLAALEQESLRVDVLLQTLDGKPLSPPELTAAGGKRILRGLIAVLALLWGLYLTADLGRFLSSGWGLRLRAVRPAAAVLLPRLCAPLLPVLLWGGGLALAVGGWRALGAFGAFMTVVLGLGLVIPRFPRLWQAVTLLLPFLALGSLLLEPVLLDIQSVMPLLGKTLGWLPVTLYCRGCDGSGAAVWLLLLEAAALAGTALLLDALERRKKA